MNEIRFANSGDAKGILDIYAPYVTNTAVSFEANVPSISEMAQRIESAIPRYCWLACVIDGEIAGYAYSSMHRSRAAYQWSCEFSVYVSPEHRRKSVAKSLYTALFEISAMQGFQNVFAGMTAPNPESYGFHTSMGFVKIGTYPKVGFKFEKWHDTEWFVNAISDFSKPPTALLSIIDLDRSVLNDIFRRAETIIRTGQHEITER